MAREAQRFSAGCLAYALRGAYRRAAAVAVFALLLVSASSTDDAGAGEPLAPRAGRREPLLRQSPAWVRARLQQMLAVDDAYLWHDVLGGRAIHQNSSGNPPTNPLEGNFHTQQQSFFALTKMYLYDLGGRKQAKLLDDARTLLNWVVENGYDPKLHQFYFRYNTRSGTWNRSFYPEFNMISVAALLRYDSLRRDPRYARVANQVFDRIEQTTLKRETPTELSLYRAGYLAIMMLDAYDATGEERFLRWSKEVVDQCNQHLWDREHGAWFACTGPEGNLPVHGTKFTHVIADMIQANYQLFLLRQGDGYRDFAEKGLAFLIEHSRSPNGLWYRHNTRDGADPKRHPGEPGDGGPGTALPYDRQMQVVVALCLGWKATRNPKYLEYIDASLQMMERTHRIVYPAGINYGYMGRSGQNTWCHLWGLKAFIALARLQREAPAGGPFRGE